MMPTYAHLDNFQSADYEEDILEAQEVHTHVLLSWAAGRGIYVAHIQYASWKLSPLNIKTGSSLKLEDPAIFSVIQYMSHAESHKVSRL
jgi:hypothetical protein